MEEDARPAAAPAAAAVAAAADDDEEDPLDAFMKGVTTVVQKLDEEDQKKQVGGQDACTHAHMIQTLDHACKAQSVCVLNGADVKKQVKTVDMESIMRMSKETEAKPEVRKLFTSQGLVSSVQCRLVLVFCRDCACFGLWSIARVELLARGFKKGISQDLS